MIEVIIRHQGTQQELGRITIENTGGTEELGDYAIKFGVEKIASVGIHTRGIWGFPRLQYNVLALLKQALDSLDEDELRLKGGASSSDLARRFRRIGSKIQRR